MHCVKIWTGTTLQEKMGILARPATQKSRVWRTLRTCLVIGANTLGYLLKLHFYKALSDPQYERNPTADTFTMSPYKMCISTLKHGIEKEQGGSHRRE